MQVVKKDGTREPFNSGKIMDAVQKAADRAGVTISMKLDDDSGMMDIIERVKIQCRAYDLVSTKDMHSFVIKALRAHHPKVAKAYEEFRDYKNTYAKAFEKVKEDADTVLLLGDKENANFDSSLVSTKGSLIKGYLTKELYKQFYLSPDELQMSKTGTIYLHDLRDMIFGSFNCCLFDMGNVLKGGFEMSNVKYTEPTSVLSALQVIGDITLVATAQQFGAINRNCRIKSS